LSFNLSIITVTKNNKAGLLRAIECVRNQTYKNIEHIIVDGGSTDGTKEMMNDGKWMMDNVKFFSEPDDGIYDAINKGIKLSTGDVIGLLHSDDLYADEKVLERYAESFMRPFDPSTSSGQALLNAGSNQGDRVDAVYSDLLYIKQKFEVQSELSKENEVQTERQFTTNYSLLTTSYSVIRYWKTQDKEFTTEAQRHRAIKNGWMPPHPTLFIRREIFEKYGLYNIDLKIASDYDMILRLLFKHKVTSYYLPVTTYLMSIGGASNKSLKNILQKSKEDYLAMKMNGINFPIFTLFSKNLRKLPQFLARDL